MNINRKLSRTVVGSAVLSTLLAIGLSIGSAPSAMATTITGSTDPADCLSVFVSGGTCTLNDDTTIDFEAAAIIINSDVTLNLAGHTLYLVNTGPATPLWGVTAPTSGFFVDEGTLTITGNGTIDASADVHDIVALISGTVEMGQGTYNTSGYDAVRVYGAAPTSTSTSALTIDANAVITQNSTSPANPWVVNIFPYRNTQLTPLYGVTVDIYGTINAPDNANSVFVNGNAQNGQGNSEINVYPGSALNGGVAAMGAATWNIYGGTITGNSTFSAFEMSGGNLNMIGGTLTTSGAMNYQPQDSGPTTSGVCLAIVNRQGYDGFDNSNINIGPNVEINCQSADGPAVGVFSIPNSKTGLYRNNLPVTIIHIDPQAKISSNYADGNIVSLTYDNSVDNVIVTYDNSVTAGTNFSWQAPLPNPTHGFDPTVTLTNQIPAIAGFTFIGWASDALCDSNAVIYLPGTNYDFNTDTTIYACWSANPPAPSGPQNSSPPQNPQGNGGDQNVYIGGQGVTSGSQVSLLSSTSSLSGGSSALANGQDTQLLQVTLNGTQAGSTAGFSISAVPGGVQLGAVTQNSDGSFTLAITSGTPGIYQVTVRYNGVAIGTVTVNFIAGDVSIPSASVGNTQTLTGLGFLPGELVTISVHSDPIQVARLAADATGKVQTTFLIPKGFGNGAHTAIFAGDKSGTATAPFTVGSVAVSTGGSVSSTGSAGLAGLLVMAGLAAGALIWRRRTSLAS